MCTFFSFCSDGKKFYYFDHELREKIRSGEIDNSLNPDSHSSIAKHFFKTSHHEDKLNKFEYNPFLNEFKIDQINIEDNSKLAKDWVEELDFKTIIPKLIIKKIVHPFELPMVEKITEEHLELLRVWVWSSVRSSIDSSVYSSIDSSVYLSVRSSVRSSIWLSVRSSVSSAISSAVSSAISSAVRSSAYSSVYLSVRSSIDSSVYLSVRSSIDSYESSFFDLEKHEWRHCDFEFEGNPFQSGIDLWEMGIVPSFDGKIWRLHSGKNAKIIWKGEL